MIKSLTCDKLSHCLFDFDNQDLLAGEDEEYHYQETLFGSEELNKQFSFNEVLDRALVLRNDNQLDLVECRTVKDEDEEFSMRLIFQPETKTLWGYHKEYFKLGKLPNIHKQRATSRACDRKFDAMPVGKINIRQAQASNPAHSLLIGTDLSAIAPNEEDSVSAPEEEVREDMSLTSKESSESEAESEADDADDCVDLEVTMWQVLRKTKAKNNFLQKIHSSICKAEIFQGDIMKFGRVNFRLVEVNSAKLLTRA